MNKQIETKAGDSININLNDKTPLIKEDSMKLENLPISTLIVKYHPRNMLGDIESPDEICNAYRTYSI